MQPAGDVVAALTSSPCTSSNVLSGLHVRNASDSIALPAAVRPVSRISGQAAARLSKQKSVAPPTALTPREIATA